MLDTHEISRGIFRFVALIPNKDIHTRLALKREKLFAAGFLGAYSFPLAAPLAAVSRPFRKEELACLARNIRELTRVNGGINADGKITACDVRMVEAGYSDSGTSGNAGGRQGTYAFFGPRLDLPLEKAAFPAAAHAKILTIFSPPVLCAALCAAPAEGETGLSAEHAILEKTPALSFRAAALVNIAVRPLSGRDIRADGNATLRGKAGPAAGKSASPAFSFEWNISPLVWLPAYKKEKRAT